MLFTMTMFHFCVLLLFNMKKYPKKNMNVIFVFIFGAVVSKIILDWNNIKVLYLEQFISMGTILFGILYTSVLWRGILCDLDIKYLIIFLVSMLWIAFERNSS